MKSWHFRFIVPALVVIIMSWLPWQSLASDPPPPKTPLVIEVKLQNTNNDSFMKKVRKIDDSINVERIKNYMQQRLADILGKIEVQEGYTKFDITLRLTKGNLEGKAGGKTAWVEVLTRGAAVLSGKPPLKKIDASATGYAGLFSLPSFGAPSQWNSITLALDALLPPLLGTFVKKGMPRQPILYVLFDLLDSPGDEVQGAAANVLGQMADPRAVDPLIKALQNGGGEVGTVATALAQLNDPKAIPPLKKQLAIMDQNCVGYGQIKAALQRLEGKKTRR